jgi:hypothetical protein
MPSLQTISVVFAVLTGSIGAITGIMSLVMTIKASRREDWKQIREDNDLAFLASLIQAQLKVGHFAGRILSEMKAEDVGSEHWKSCERLLERGFLERGPNGKGYTIKGFEDMKAEPRKKWEPLAPPPIDIDRRR